MNLRRVKAYTGNQGYVYEYYFVGKRPALPGDSESPATEFVFDVSTDRKTKFAVSIFLLAEAVKSWGATHGRGLSDAEQYGAVKMRLFQAFDEVEDMRGEGRRLKLDAVMLEEVLARLGIE
jgi:hypothetical protein